MRQKRRRLASIIVMSMIAAIGVSSIMGSVKSQDADSTSAGRSEGHDEGGEETGTAYALDETFDAVSGGARLILSYCNTSDSFVGMVENVTDATLEQVRVEVHLSNGIELGPTTPIALAPGEQSVIMLDSGDSEFESWTPHAEVGYGEHGIPSDSSSVGAEGDEHGAESGIEERERRPGSRSRMRRQPGQ